MKRHLSNRPWVFFALVFAMSALIWTIDLVAEQLLPPTGETPIGLPISSLATLCPFGAAVILVQRERGWGGVKTLLQRSFDWRRTARKTWLLPIFFLMPAIVILQYGLTSTLRASASDPPPSVSTVPLLLLMFAIAAVGEEVGWQGYAVEPLLDRWNALTAGIVLGIVGAIWHIVPLMQLHRPPAWIAWQCMNAVVTRVLIVWIYANTGKSVLAAILYHIVYNVSTMLLPGYGLHYDPFVSFILTAVAAAIVAFLWGAETLARYGYARKMEER